MVLLLFTLLALGKIPSVYGEVSTRLSLSSTQKSQELFTLSNAITIATQLSPSIKNVQAQAESAKLEAHSAESTLYPKLTLEGNFREQSVIPQVTLGPTLFRLTDNHSYSVGPTLTYMIWDFGATRNRIENLSFLAQARKYQAKLSQSQIRLATQLAYLQATLSSEILGISMNAAELARVQNHDIQFRYKGGSATQLDALTSGSDVLSYQLKVKQAEVDWVSNLSDLSYYVASVINPKTRLESLNDLMKALGVPQHKQTDLTLADHPLIASQNEFEKAAASQLKLQKSAYWPSLLLQARSSLDYPNGPIFQRINQNSVALNLSWTLFDFSGTKNLVASKSAQLQMALFAKEETTLALKRDRDKTWARMENLAQQIKDAEEFATKQKELAQLNYAAYQYGSLRFSEVQNANLRYLDAENRLVLLRAQYLSQAYTLEYLTEGNSHE